MKTAVEFLEQEIKKLNISVNGANQELAINIIEQAKALEKQQIIEAYNEDNTSYFPTEQRKIKAENYFTQKYEQ